jgi:hypothetical protein
MRWVFLSLVCLNLLVMVWFWKDQNNSVSIKQGMQVQTQKGDSLVLLSEVKQSDLNYKKADINPASSRKDERCYSVGPFQDESDAKFLAIRAEALGFSSNMRSLTTGGEVESWVHIPPLANRIQAMQLLRELQSRGIDSYIVTQGELAEGISLGLFKNEVSAKNLMKDMRGMGYDVIIKEVPRGEKELWLEFSQVSQLTEVMRKRIMGDGLKSDWMLTDCINI